MKQSQHRPTAMERATAGAIKHVGTLIIVLGVLYSDVMFVSLMWTAFPEGLLRILALGGAFVTGFSVIALYMGKSHWFRPGGQLIWAWAFTWAEIAISIMNVIVSVMVARHDALGVLSYWLLVAPGTPFMGVIGWIFISYLDPSRKQRHDRMEMEDDLHAADLEYERASHKAALRIKHAALKIHEGYMAQELDSEERQAQIAQAASNLTSDTLAQLTGGYIPRRIVQSQQPKALPEPQQPPALQQPTQHVEQVFTEQPQDMQKWLELYQESGDNSIMSFPEFVKQMQIAVKRGETADPLGHRLQEWVSGIMGKNGNGAKPQGPTQE